MSKEYRTLSVLRRKVKDNGFQLECVCDGGVGVARYVLMEVGI